MKRSKRLLTLGVISQIAIGLLLAPLVSGCAVMSSAGPSSRAVHHAEGQKFDSSGIRVIDLSDALVRQMIARQHSSLFSEVFQEASQSNMLIGEGDLVDVAIWEAPPAALFGADNQNLLAGSKSTVARQTNLPGQVVDSMGQITVPFVGQIQAAGRTPQQIAAEITRRLKGKAHEPQVIVKLADNAATNVTVVGETAKNIRMPLTSKRERLLDALAAAGGSKQPVGKTTIQLTRGSIVETLPLDAIVRDPRQNIALQANDVITALYQPYSFTALGAIGRNSEIDFEGTGLTLAQALGRIGGLDDSRASARGVFIFRLEDKAALGLAGDKSARTTPDGKVPVIYRVNLGSPETFFIAQSFPIKNKDVMYISNAPLADLQKFVSIVASLVYPAIMIDSASRNN